MARTLTIRLDDETDDALKVRESEDPSRPTSEVIREAIGEQCSFVYFVRRSDSAVKIGFSASLKLRLQKLRSEYGVVALEAAIPGGRKEEAEMHAKHASCRLGKTEWFQGDSVEQEIRAALLTCGTPEECLAKVRNHQRIVLVMDDDDRAVFAQAATALQRGMPPGALVAASDVIREGLRLLSEVDQ